MRAVPPITHPSSKIRCGWVCGRGPSSSPPSPLAAFTVVAAAVVDAVVVVVVVVDVVVVVVVARGIGSEPESKTVGDIESGPKSASEVEIGTGIGKQKRNRTRIGIETRTSKSDRVGSDPGLHRGIPIQALPGAWGAPRAWVTACPGAPRKMELRRNRSGAKATPRGRAGAHASPRCRCAGLSHRDARSFFLAGSASPAPPSPCIM